MTHKHEPNESRSSELDALLRDALEPPPGVARRLVEKALQGEAPAPAVVAPWRRWGLATVAAMALALVLVAPHWRTPSPLKGVDPPMTVAANPTPASPSAADERPLLTISNTGGVLEITSSAGPKIILYPEDSL